MTEDHDLDELSQREALEALGALEPEAAPLSSGARAYLETLGAIPYALEPMTPSPRVKEMLMAEVGGETGVAMIAEFPAAVERSAGGSKWMMGIAAVLALVLLGVSARQFVQLADQGHQITELQRELAERLPADARPPEWMAASGTELCALSPRQAAHKDSKGWLFVRQDHQHWYVAVEGLASAPEGHVYELWFVVESELVSGGTFHPDGEGRAILTSETMPDQVTGFAITLEPDNGDGIPSETMVLYGDEVMLTL